MSIEFYIKDDQGTYVSEDANVRYRKLKGKALHEYLMSEEGKSKSFHVETDEYGNKLGIEVNPEIVKKLQKEINHTEYIQRSKYEKGYEYISLDLLFRNGEPGIELIEAIADVNVDVENDALREIDIERVRYAMRHLDESELCLIYDLFISKNSKSEYEIAKDLHISQQAISKRKKAVFEKLKKYF